MYDEIDDYSRLRTNGELSRSKNPCLVIGMTCIICLLIACASVQPDRTIFEYDETLTLFLSSSEGVISSHKYREWVTLHFQGIGNITDAVLTDSFFKFDLNGALHPWDEEPQTYGIVIDGKRAEPDGNDSRWTVKYPFRVSQAHAYVLMYYVGTDSRSISFVSADDTYQDNSGELVIQISQDMHPSFRGR